MAFVVGISTGLFASGYWLNDVLPVGSRLLAVLACLLIAVGAVACYILLQWARIPFRGLTGLQQVALLALSVAAGAALLYGGTSQWRSASRYVPFFLPSHHLQISVVSEQASPTASSDFKVLWFSTSLGDISYDTIQLKGWKRTGDELALLNPTENSLLWTGKTGETVEFVFRDLSPGEKLLMKWDSAEEVIRPTAGKFTYQKTLDVPWYASKTFVLFLGVIAFAVVAFALLLLLWEKRAALRSIADGLPVPAAKRLDRWDAIWILAIAVVALLLRLPNLGALFPAVDEYYHLIAARQIIEGAALSSVYPRGLWIVTLPVSFALRVFGYQLWAARVVGVLFNVLAILPLYLLTSRINRSVAVLSAGLYATSPWIVTFARMAREYAFYPFYFYWILYGMIVFVQSVPRDFVVLRDWKTLIRPKPVLIGLALVLPPLFALYGDRLSTFRTIMIAYPVFGVFVLARFNLRDRSNLPFLAVLGGGLLAMSYSWYERQKFKILPIPSYNSVPVEYFLPNPQQQWYFERIVPIVVAGLLAISICSFILLRRNFIPGFMVALWATYLAFFALFSKTFFHTRHLSTTELWYVIVVGIGLYLVWKTIMLLSPWKGTLANVVVATALGLSAINVSQLFAPSLSTNPDNPISEDYLHDLTEVHAFMLGHVQPQDVLISTVYGLYSSWKEEPQFEARYRITTQTPREDIFALIDQNESGWIVIDHIRLAMSTLGAREFAGNSAVRFVGSFGDEYVWHWQHSPAGLGGSIVAGKGP